MTPHTFLFALVDGGGTVPPELGAARRLVDRGHDVTVLAENTMTAEVEATGARFRPWVQAPNRPSRSADDDPYRDWECTSPLKLFDRLLEKQFVGPAASYAADVDEAIAGHRPDVVVCSMFAVGAMVAAESAGIPFHVLLPNAYLLPADGMPPIGMGLRPAKGAPGRLRDRAVRALTDRLWDKGLARLNALRVERGLAPVDHFWDQAHHAARHIVMTSTAFDFPAALPDRVRYVGAVLDDPTWALHRSGDAWTPPPGDEPLVLVAFSSTFQDQADCLQRVIDALSTLPVRAVVTTGPALDPASLAPAPNVTVVASAPHRQVLEHAAVVVTHGGHGTVIKSLAAGTPLLVLPHGRDQLDNAVRVTSRGAGLKLKPAAKPSAIAHALRQLLDEPSFRHSAEALGAAIRRDAEGDALVHALEGDPLVPAQL